MCATSRVYLIRKDKDGHEIVQWLVSIKEILGGQKPDLSLSPMNTLLVEKNTKTKGLTTSPISEMTKN